MLGYSTQRFVAYVCRSVILCDFFGFVCFMLVSLICFVGLVRFLLVLLVGLVWLVGPARIYFELLPHREIPPLPTHLPGSKNKEGVKKSFFRTRSYISDPPPPTYASAVDLEKSRNNFYGR